MALVRWWRAGALPTEQPPAADAPPEAVRWEYYLGGMVGLVLAFALRAGTLPVGDLTSETIAAGVGSMVWFAAFGLYERLASSTTDRVAALTLGVVSLAVALLDSPGFTFPAVAGPL